MKRFVFKLFFVFTGLFFLYWPVRGQFYTGSHLTFGKNRVQYGNNFWSYIRFEKFDTYFYTNGKELAIYTARYANKTITEIEKKLDYSLEEKIQFIIYNKYTDLQQSNIGLISDENYNTGGMTHIVGSKVFIYFNGNHFDFEKQIRAGIAQVLVDEMIYGGKIGSNIKNSALISLPAWFTQGLVSYLANDWDANLDNFVKDGILRGHYNKYSNLTGDEAVYAGHSIWKFVADKYGQNAIPNIVYLTKVSRNVENGFLYVLGAKFKTLASEWIAYYEQMYLKDDENRQQISSQLVLKKPKKNTVYSQLKISPDGNFAAYVSNIMGQYRVFVYDIASGKRNKIMKREIRFDEKNDFSFPLLAWHPTGKLLAIITEIKGKNMLYSYYLEEDRFEKEQLFNLEKILDFSYSHNGKMMVMSGVSQGQSDIYVFNIAAHTFEPITKDIYDDLHPRFINNSKDIIFSSNRIDDTVRIDKITNFETPKDTIAELPPKNDIFIYHYNKKNPVLKRVTNTSHTNEKQPMAFEKNLITYLSEENGIYNRFIGRLDSTISYVDTTTHWRYYTTSFPVTNYSRNIIEHDFTGKQGYYGEIIFTKGLYRLYISDTKPVKHSSITLPENTFYRDFYLKEIAASEQIMRSPINTQEVEMLKARKSRNKPRKTQNTLLDVNNFSSDTSVVDINNYSFGLSDADTIKTSDTIPQKKPFKISREGNYDVEYSINQLVGQLDFNYLNASYQQYTGGNYPIFLNSGLNATIQLGIIDLLEDHRISGGARIALSFDDYDFFIGYENLKKRLDKGLFYYRQANVYGGDYSIIKLRSNALVYSLKWPFNRVFALKGSASIRHDKRIFASTDVQNLKTPSENEYWAGIKAELIYDNTQSRFINIYYGWRWKIFGEYYQKISDNFKNLVVIGADFRYYQKIHRTFIWANRIAGSTSFGSNKLVYYMGGVDNWIIPSFNRDNRVYQSNNYTYQTLATNLRGFSQNIRNGPNFIVLNSELRFPVVRYFSKKPLKNNFITNLQIIAFGDIGTAWVGWNPYSEENTLTKEVIERGPMTITMIKKRDPLVGGFGAGLRTKLFGYFIRADYAWGIENAVIQKPVFYISVGLDF